MRNLGAFWVLNSKNVDIKGFLKSHALRVPRGSFGEDPGNLDFSRFPGFFICAFRRVRSECILPEVLKILEGAERMVYNLH